MKLSKMELGVVLATIVLTVVMCLWPPQYAVYVRYGERQVWSGYWPVWSLASFDKNGWGYPVRIAWGRLILQCLIVITVGTATIFTMRQLRAPAV